jgi:hypothetical protein
MALSIPCFAEVVEMHASVTSVKIIAYWLTHGDGVEGGQFVLEDWGVSILSFGTRWYVGCLRRYSVWVS